MFPQLPFLHVEKGLLFVEECCTPRDWLCLWGPFTVRATTAAQLEQQREELQLLQGEGGDKLLTVRFVLLAGQDAL